MRSRKVTEGTLEKTGGQSKNEQRGPVELMNYNPRTDTVALAFKISLAKDGLCLGPNILITPTQMTVCDYQTEGVLGEVEEGIRGRNGD